MFSLFVFKVMAPCCLFLAAKVEEQPRKLEHVIRVAHACLHREGPPLDPKSEVKNNHLNVLFTGSLLGINPVYNRVGVRPTGTWDNHLGKCKITYGQKCMDTCVSV